MQKTRSPEKTILSTTDHKVLRTEKLIFATTSSIRIKLLKSAGVEFTTEHPNINEQLEQNIRQHYNAETLAIELARLKSQSISKPETLILGADQTLDCEGLIFHKPKNEIEALKQLQHLMGKTHTLTSAVAISCEENLLWQHESQAKLTMRNYSPEFLKQYITQNSPQILSSVGCYQLENSGIQLFEKIEGDYFTILGLPLLPCLAFLRSIDFIKS